MDQSNWEKIGIFEIALPDKGNRRIKARTTGYSEDFRMLAKSMRALWSPSDKSWCFEASSESTLREALSKLSDKSELLEAEKKKIAEKAFELLSVQPLRFSNPELSIETDLANKRFLVRFPYANLDKFGPRVRAAGGRWDSELRCNIAPLSAHEELLTIIKPFEEELLRFNERNKKAMEEELVNPITAQAAILMKEIPEEIQVEFEASFEDMTMKATLPFSLSSKLGYELFAPLHSIPEVGETKRYPRLTKTTIIVEMHQAQQLLSAMRPAFDAMSKYGTAEKISIDFEGQRAAIKPPQAESGGLLLRDHAAYLILKSHKNKSKLSILGLPISSKQASKMVSEMSYHQMAECCLLSGIESAAMSAHLEGLSLREEVAQASTQEAPAGRAQKTRL